MALTKLGNMSIKSLPAPFADSFLILIDNDMVVRAAFHQFKMFSNFKMFKMAKMFDPWILTFR